MEDVERELEAEMERDEGICREIESSIVRTVWVCGERECNRVTGH